MAGINTDTIENRRPTQAVSDDQSEAGAARIDVGASPRRFEL